MSTQAIERFLQTAYSDEKLAALLAHAEDGKLSYWSCCCVMGAASADHALTGRSIPPNVACPTDHWTQEFPEGGWAVSHEFLAFGSTDAERSAKLIPLIRAEMQRRDSLATHNVPANTWDNNVSKEGMFCSCINKLILK